jgi:hypothetical protein
MLLSSRAAASNPVGRAGLLRRGACHRAGHFGPDPFAPRNDVSQLTRCRAPRNDNSRGTAIGKVRIVGLCLRVGEKSTHGRLES